MRNRIILSAMTISFVFILSGCQTDIEKMDDIYSSLKTISMQSDNCEEMAENLLPVTERFLKEIEKSNYSEDNEINQEYGKSVHRCMSAYMDIRSGPCGEEKCVLEAMPPR